MPQTIHLEHDCAVAPDTVCASAKDFTMLAPMSKVNDAERRFVSHEQGAGVKSWIHTLSIVPTETGCCQIDEIEIDAGLMTPLVALLSKRMYRKRGTVRARLLRGYRR